MEAEVNKRNRRLSGGKKLRGTTISSNDRLGFFRSTQLLKTIKSP